MYVEKYLDNYRDYAQVFNFVKKTVKESVGKERIGLILYLGNLPLNIGAYHSLGSNSIVVNKRLLELIDFKTITELNSYVYMILLHEYLHSLGYVDEKQVRSLVFEISKKYFGDNHPATRFALSPPSPRIIPSELNINKGDANLEIVKNFERSNTESYLT